MYHGTLKIFEPFTMITVQCIGNDYRKLCGKNQIQYNLGIPTVRVLDIHCKSIPEKCEIVSCCTVQLQRSHSFCNTCKDLLGPNHSLICPKEPTSRSRVGLQRWQSFAISICQHLVKESIQRQQIQVFFLDSFYLSYRVPSQSIRSLLFAC